MDRNQIRYKKVNDAVKNMAVKMELKPQEVLQIFMFERMIERPEASDYKITFLF